MKIANAHDFDILTKRDGTVVLTCLDDEQDECIITITRSEVEALTKKLANMFLTILYQ